jgi:hypothetical protein
MCGYMACVLHCRGSVSCAPQLSAYSYIQITGEDNGKPLLNNISCLGNRLQGHQESNQTRRTTTTNQCTVLVISTMSNTVQTFNSVFNVQNFSTSI